MIFFGGKLWLFSMVIEMAFDQAIWYLKIILPEDTVWWIYLCNCNLATTFFRFWRVVSADLTKRLKELYSADGQIVIPLEGLAISQPVGLWAHKATWALHPLPQTCRRKFHGCELPRLKSTGEHWLKICTRQPWTIFFFFFFLHMSSTIAFPTFSQWKNKNTSIWKAAD